MSDDAIEVKIGADASGLVAGAGSAKAALQGLSKEFLWLRNAIENAAAAQTGELIAALESLDGPAKKATKNIKEFHEAVAGGGRHGGGNLGGSLFELHAMFDEWASGRSNRMITSFSILVQDLASINLGLAIAVGAAAALGIAAYKTYEYFNASKETLKAINQSLAYSANYGVVDPKVLGAAAEKLRSIQGLYQQIVGSEHGFNNEKLDKMISDFATMSGASNEVIVAMATNMQTMWQQFGDSEEKAGQNMVELFQKWSAPIEEQRKLLKGLTDEEENRIRLAQLTNNRLEVQAAFEDVIAGRRRNQMAGDEKSAAVKAAGIKKQIADEQAYLATMRDQATEQGRSEEFIQRALFFHEGLLAKLREELSAAEKLANANKAAADALRAAPETSADLHRTARDWSQGADQKGDELEKLNEQIAKGYATLARLKKEAASQAAGEGVFGGLAVGADIAKLTRDIEVLLDKRRKLQEEMSGTNPKQQAEAANLKAQVEGHADAVEAAQRELDAANSNLARQNLPENRGPDSAAYQWKEKAEIDLANKRLALSMSTAQLEAAMAGKNYQTRYAAEVKLNELKKQGANGDPAKLNEVAADRARIEQAHNEKVQADAADALDRQINKLRDDTAQKLKIYADDERMHKMTVEEGAAASKAALAEEQAGVDALYAKKLALYANDLDKKRQINDEIEKSDRAIKDEIDQQTRQAADAYAKTWQNAADTVTGAMTSHYRALFSGQGNLGTSFRKILGDWVIESAAAATKMAANFLLQYAIINHGAEASAAFRVAADQTAAAGGIAAMLANAVRAVTVDAGVTFGGVFANLSPILGPAAAGPAAAAQAAVAGVAMADIGMWNVPADALTMIHKGELVATPGQAEAIRSLPGILANGGGAGGPSAVINPSTHFHVNALDGASVGQWFRGNQKEMMRAIDGAVRHGAHLGLRRIAPA